MTRSARRLGLLAVILAACTVPAGTSEPLDAPASATAAPSTALGAPDESHSVTGEVPQELLGRILAEAMERTGASADELRVVVAEPVTWNDGSLGCPQPGMAYTMALVPGYRVVVEAGGVEHHYHASDRGTFTYCTDPQPPAEGAVDR